MSCQRGDLYLHKICKEVFYAQHCAEENKINNGTERGYVATLFQRSRSDRMTRSDEFERDRNEVVEAYSQHCTVLCPNEFRKYLKTPLSVG